MSSWGLQVEAFQPQMPYLASPAFTHLLSPAFLPPSCRGWTVAHQPAPWTPRLHNPMALAPRQWLLELPAPSSSSPYCGVCS